MNMKFLGLYPDSIVARVRASPKPTRVPTLAGSLAVGAGGFCLVGAVVSIAKTAAHEPLQNQVGEIGRASCRERVGSSVVAVAVNRVPGRAGNDDSDRVP